jgi:hypothetical protein
MQTTRPLTLLLRCGVGALLALTLFSALGGVGVFSASANPGPSATTPSLPSSYPVGNELFRSDYKPWIIGILCVFALATILLYWAMIARRPKHPRLDLRARWTLSIGFSILCALAILTIWITLSLAPFPQGDGVPILSQHDLDRYLTAQTAAAPGQPRILIPTGVFVESIEFTSAFNPIVSGYIWQKYTPQIPADVARGFVLPDATDLTSDEAYHLTEGDTQVIGWSFRATLRQVFDYDQYPFDRQYLWVRVNPADHTHNVVLTPDFASYTTMRPEALPGVQPTLVIENWDLRQTFFNYHTAAYNTNLGIDHSTRQTDYPELYYSIGLSRQILGAFITYIIPPLIALIMLFGVLMLTTRRQDRRDSSGWNSTNALAFCAALFFVVIVSHVNLRQQVSAGGILYLGWFYFLTYFAILLVSVNAILFILAGDQFLLQREDNLVAKLLYWPILTFVMLVITVAVFF